MRKVKQIVIPDEPRFERDKGKVFVIREMDAWQAEEWAHRAMEAVAVRTAVPEGVANAGMLGIYIVGLRALMAAPHDMVKPLMDEMFANCLSIQPSAANPAILRGAGTPEVKSTGIMVPSDTEEVATRVYLRDQIFELHTGFSLAAVLSQQWASLMAVAKNLQATPTSPAPSEPLSPAA